MLKNALLPRLLRKVQMSLDLARDREPVERQGGAPGTHSQDGHPSEWVPGVRLTSPVRRSAAQSRGVPVRRMGPRRWAFFSSLLGGMAVKSLTPIAHLDERRAHTSLDNARRGHSQSRTGFHLDGIEQLRVLSTLRTILRKGVSDAKAEQMRLAHSYATAELPLPPDSGPLSATALGVPRGQAGRGCHATGRTSRDVPAPHPA